MQAQVRRGLGLPFDFTLISEPLFSGIACADCNHAGRRGEEKDPEKCGQEKRRWNKRQ